MRMCKEQLLDKLAIIEEQMAMLEHPRSLSGHCALKRYEKLRKQYLLELSARPRMSG